MTDEEIELISGRSGTFNGTILLYIIAQADKVRVITKISRIQTGRGPKAEYKLEAAIGAVIRATPLET